MAASVFERMHDRLFARLGEEAILRGAVSCAANIEYGVVMQFEPGDDKFVMSEMAAVVDIANIQRKYNPKPGDTLSVGAKQYVIDAIVADNGFMSRCVLRSPTL